MRCIKLNSDVAWLDQFFPVVLFVVARDNIGRILHSIAMRIWFSSIVTGKARVVMAATKMAYDADF